MTRFIVTYLILGTMVIFNSLGMDIGGTQACILGISEPVVVIPSGIDYVKGRVVNLAFEIIELEGGLRKETDPTRFKNLKNSIIPSKKQELELLKKVSRFPNVYLDSIVRHLYTILKEWKSDDSSYNQETLLLINLYRIGADHPKVVEYANQLTPSLDGIKIIHEEMFLQGPVISSDLDSECRSMRAIFQCDFISFIAENWAQKKKDVDYKSLIKNSSLWFLETDYASYRIEILKEFWDIPIHDQPSVADFSSVFIQDGKSPFWKRRKSPTAMRSLLIQAAAKIPLQDRPIVQQIISLLFQVKLASFIVSIPFWEINTALMIEYLSFLLPKSPSELRDKAVCELKSLMKSGPVTSLEDFDNLFLTLKQRKYNKENEGDCILF